MLDGHENSDIFRPNWPAPPIFFLHIPKTAGSSNNAFLRHIYGSSNFQAHAENFLPELTSGRTPPLTVDCISGHIPLWAWRLYNGSRNYACSTLLRDPWQRIVSHVNWVKLFNHRVRMRSHGPGAKDLAKVVEMIAKTDFGNRESLRALFNLANDLKYFSRFDNYQVRMLRSGAMDAMERKLSRQDLDVSCSELASFFHFGFCEDQNGFQTEMIEKAQLRGTPTKLQRNSGKLKILSPDNDLAREVFAPWMEFDQALVGFARVLLHERQRLKCDGGTPKTPLKARVKAAASL